MFIICLLIYLCSVITCGLYAYDYRLDKLQQDRIPEPILLIATIALGSLGALMAMWLFRSEGQRAKYSAVAVICLVLTFGLVYLYRLLNHIYTVS